MAALSDAAAAIDMDNTNAVAWVQLCHSFTAMGMPLFAADAARAAVHLRPHDEALQDLGRRYPDRPPLDPQSLAQLGSRALGSGSPGLVDFAQSDACFGGLQGSSQEVKLSSVALPPRPPPPLTHPALALQRCDYGWGVFATQPIADGQLLLEEKPMVRHHASAGHCNACCQPLASTAESTVRYAVACPDCQAAFYCSEECRAEAERKGHRLLCSTGYRVEAVRAALPAAVFVPDRFPPVAAHMVALSLAGVMEGATSLDLYSGFGHLSFNPGLELPFAALWNGFRRFSWQLHPLLRTHFTLWWYMTALAITMNNAFGDLGPGRETTEIMYPHAGKASRYTVPWSLSPVPLAFAALKADSFVRPKLAGSLDLFALLCLFNHSCDPNTVLAVRGGCAVLRAERPITVGEQVFVSYMPGGGTRQERQASLEERYGFRCACSLCAAGR
eukprot:EG_transcript_7379